MSETTAFDILSLPDKEFSHVLKFLNLQDKKNLREVCVGLGNRVLRNDPEIAHWRLKMWDAREISHLDAALHKGLMKMPNFKLHVSIINPECRPKNFELDGTLIRFLTCLKDKIIGLDTFTTPKLLNVHLPHLEILNLAVYPATKKTSGQMALKYSSTLKELGFVRFGTVGDIFSASDPGIRPAPRLQCLKAEFVSPAILSFARNVTKLVFHFECQAVFPRGKKPTSTHFKFPNLKELFLGRQYDPKIARMLIECNSEHLETLNLNTEDGEKCRLKLSPGLVLPMLTTYVAHDMDSPIIPQILRASSLTLKRLIVISKQLNFYDGDVNFGKDVPLPRLTDIIAPLTPWSKRIVCQNPAAMELIVFELLERNDDVNFLLPSKRKSTPPTLHYSKLDGFLGLNLPSLKKMVVLDGQKGIDEDQYDSTEPSEEERKLLSALKEKLLSGPNTENPGVRHVLHKIIGVERDFGNREDARAKLETRFPHADITFDARKLSDMTGKDGDKPGYLEEYLRAHGFEY